jgi:hypothetical protein
MEMRSEQGRHKAKAFGKAFTLRSSCDIFVSLNIEIQRVGCFLPGQGFFPQ